jgi:hypothetical protein
VDFERPLSVMFVRSLNGERSPIYDAENIATYMVDRLCK